MCKAWAYFRVEIWTNPNIVRSWQIHFHFFTNIFSNLDKSKLEDCRRWHCKILTDIEQTGRVCHARPWETITGLNKYKYKYKHKYRYKDKYRILQVGQDQHISLHKIWNICHGRQTFIYGEVNIDGLKKGNIFCKTNMKCVKCVKCYFSRVGWAFLLSSGAALKVNQRKNPILSLITKDYHTIRWLQCDGDGVIGTELGRPLQLLQQVRHCQNHKTFFFKFFQIINHLQSLLQS